MRLAFFTGMLCALATISHAQTQNQRLHLRYGVFDPTLGAPIVPQALSAGTDTDLYIVQFDHAFTDRDREALRRLSGVLYTPLPRRALVVKLDATAVRDPRSVVPAK